MASSTTPVAALARLAWRNLWRNHRRTLIMLLAITVGVWAMIFMTAVMRGMVDQVVEDGIDALPGMVQIHHSDYRDDPSVENSLAPPGPELLQALNSEHVSAWTARVRVPAMISSERDSRGIVLLGVEPASEIDVAFDPDSIVRGRFLQDAGDEGLVLGRRLVDRLETGLGKRVVVMSQDIHNDIADRGFRVVGVYEAKLASLEERFAYAGRSTVQRLLGLGERLSEIAVDGHDFRDTSTLSGLLSRAAPAEAEVLPWSELDSYLALMMNVMEGFVLIWIIVIFVALSFGLVNTLMMAIFERIREIGLIQALGMKPASIVYQVLLESLMLLLLGLLLGNLLALATVWPLQDGLDLSVVAKGMEMMGASSVLYPALKADDILLANLVVIVLGVLTSLIPAWRASRYRPVEAIAKI